MRASLFNVWKLSKDEPNRYLLDHIRIRSNKVEASDGTILAISEDKEAEKCDLLCLVRRGAAKYICDEMKTKVEIGRADSKVTLTESGDTISLAESEGRFPDVDEVLGSLGSTKAEVGINLCKLEAAIKTLREIHGPDMDDPDEIEPVEEKDKFFRARISICDNDRSGHVVLEVEDDHIKSKVVIMGLNKHLDKGIPQT